MKKKIGIVIVLMLITVGVFAGCIDSNNKNSDSDFNPPSSTGCVREFYIVNYKLDKLIDMFSEEQTIVFARNGDILFDCNKARFVQLREIDYLNMTVFCGGFTVFYNDANTTIREQRLSFSYIANNCVPIGQIDKFPFAEYVESVGGWKVKT